MKMSYLLGLIGIWIVTDGIFSLSLYLNQPSYNGSAQTWRRDHWVRCVRIGLGLAVIAIGAMGVYN